MARARSGRPYLMEASATVSFEEGLVARWKAVIVMANMRKGLTMEGWDP